MSSTNIFIMVVISLIALAVLRFLFIQNRKDKKAFRPEDTEDLMEETRNDIEREKDKN